MSVWKLSLAVLIPCVAIGFLGCEKSDDAAGAYWNQQGTGGTGDERPSTGGGGGGDAINPNSIRYLHADVSSWPVTSSLNVSIGGGTVSLAYDKANVWPGIGGLNANPWIIVNVNGEWVAATFEWFRNGQTTKPMNVVEGGHIKAPPLSNFRPVSGETYGWMVTSLARDSKRTVNERTNIVMAQWP